MSRQDGGLDEGQPLLGLSQASTVRNGGRLAEWRDTFDHLSDQYAVEVPFSLRDRPGSRLAKLMSAAIFLTWLIVGASASLGPLVLQRKTWLHRFPVLSGVDVPVKPNPALPAYLDESKPRRDGKESNNSTPIVAGKRASQPDSALSTAESSPLYLWEPPTDPAQVPQPIYCRSRISQCLLNAEGIFTTEPWRCSQFFVWACPLYPTGFYALGFVHGLPSLFVISILMYVFIFINLKTGIVQVGVPNQNPPHWLLAFLLSLIIFRLFFTVLISVFLWLMFVAFYIFWIVFMWTWLACSTTNASV